MNCGSSNSSELFIPAFFWFFPLLLLFCSFAWSYLLFWSAKECCAITTLFIFFFLDGSFSTALSRRLLSGVSLQRPISIIRRRSFVCALCAWLTSCLFRLHFVRITIVGKWIKRERSPHYILFICILSLFNRNAFSYAEAVLPVCAAVRATVGRKQLLLNHQSVRSCQSFLNGWRCCRQMRSVISGVCLLRRTFGCMIATCAGIIFVMGIVYRQYTA